MRRATVFIVRCIVLLHLLIYAQAQTTAVCELQYDAVGREDSIVVIAWNHDIKSPRDAHSKTSEAPPPMFEITKLLDHTTPAFMRALKEQSSGHMTILCDYRAGDAPERNGAAFQAFSIEMVDATISGIRTEKLNNRYSENMKHEFRERVTFTYQHINWNFEYH